MHFISQLILSELLVGIVVILIALTMINGKIGEHKMNKEEKSETSMTTILAVVPLPRQLWQAPVD